MRGIKIGGIGEKHLYAEIYHIILCQIQKQGHTYGLYDAENTTIIG